MNQTLKISVGLSRKGINHIIKGNRIIVQGGNAIKVNPVEGEDPKVTILKQMKKDGSLKTIMDKFKVDINRIIMELAPRFSRAKMGAVNVWSLTVSDINKKYQVKVPLDMNTGKVIQKPSELLKAIK